MMACIAIDKTSTEQSLSQWYEMTPNYWMMMERYPNLKEEVGSLISSCEMSSLLDKKAYQVINCLMCFGATMSAFYLLK
jgi:hypothetical protein